MTATWRNLSAAQRLPARIRQRSARALRSSFAISAARTRDRFSTLSTAAFSIPTTDLDGAGEDKVGVELDGKIARLGTLTLALACASIFQRVPRLAGLL